MTPAEYWELRARQRDVELYLCELKLLSASHWKDDGDVKQLLSERLNAAVTARATLAQSIDLPSGDLVWDDATCQILTKDDHAKR